MSASNAGENLRPGTVTAAVLRSTFAPQDGRCMCLSDGGSADRVRRLNDTEGPPCDLVVTAMGLTP